MTGQKICHLYEVKTYIIYMNGQKIYHMKGQEINHFCERLEDMSFIWNAKKYIIYRKEEEICHLYEMPRNI